MRVSLLSLMTLLSSLLIWTSPLSWLGSVELLFSSSVGRPYIRPSPARFVSMTFWCLTFLVVLIRLSKLLMIVPHRVVRLWAKV